MPEGDTLFRAARTLGRALAGRKVLAASTQVAAVDAESLIGRTVAAVEAKGKNLIIRFDDGRLLRTHLRMNGSWHVYRPGEKWWKPARLARLVLETDAFVAVCFEAPVIELMRAKDERVHAPLATLGPDILAETFDLEGARERLRSLSELPIGVAIVEQRAVAGIGNIYKSESLFLAGVDPFARVDALDDAALDTILRRARALMQAATRDDGWRGSGPGGRDRAWVYRRSGQPCRRCRTRIEMRRQGEGNRSTYYCPTCQRVAAAPAGAAPSGASGAASSPPAGGSGSTASSFGRS
jgi:endonuclease-8